LYDTMSARTLYGLKLLPGLLSKQSCYSYMHRLDMSTATTITPPLLGGTASCTDRLNG